MKELEVVAIPRCGTTVDEIPYYIGKLDVGQYLLLESKTYKCILKITKIISEDEYLAILDSDQVKLAFYKKLYYDFSFRKVKIFSDYAEFLLTEGL